MPPDYVVVIGGANTDVKARSTATVVPGTSNPGSTRSSPGGVGRNIAENLARLGTETHLVSAVGNDPLGDALLAATQEAGVRVEHVRRSTRGTGTYTAVLSPVGELVVAVADMSATEDVTPDAVDDAAELIAGAGLLVLDGNLGVETVVRAVGAGQRAGVRIVIEPVSVPKARTLVLGRHRVHTMTPNLDELAALTGRAVSTDAEVAAAVEALHAKAVEVVWVRRGEAGSLLSTATGVTRLDADPTRVVDVTGAGDAMTAAYCHAVLAGRSPEDAAREGHRAAALTVASDHTVRPDLSDLLRSSQ